MVYKWNSLLNEDHLGCGCRVQVLARVAAKGAVDASQFLSFLAALLLGRMAGVSACADPQRAAALVRAAARAIADAGQPGVCCLLTAHVRELSAVSTCIMLTFGM